jgi:hypothetical protein
MSQREEDETRKNLVINPDGSPVDYSGIPEAMEDDTPEQSADLVVIESKEVTDPQTLNTVYDDTLGYRIRCSFADGEGVIYSLIGTMVLGTAAMLWMFYLWLAEIVTWVAAQASTIGGALALVLLVSVIAGFKSSKSGTVVVKGCPKGPTPGSVRISRH